MDDLSSILKNVDPDAPLDFTEFDNNLKLV